jgi:nucleoside-diphosphate-sugar epimerase
MASGKEVVVLDNLSAGNLQNLKPWFTEKNFRFVYGDIREKKVLGKVLKGVDAVIHEAAITSVPFSIENPKLTKEVNLSGTVNLLQASSKAKVKRFVLASSCAVYGEQDKFPISEKADLHPLSPYAESKLEAERKCLEFHERGEIETVCLRYFNVYGPRQAAGEYAGVMVEFLNRLKLDQPPIIYGSGEQSRDFIFVGDVARATILALRRKRAAGEILNIGSGEATTINSLCRIFLKLMEKNLEPVYGEARSGEIQQSQANISKAIKLLKFRPEISLEEGLRELIGKTQPKKISASS